MTRKTRLSALATAFGLTLTLGLALPIMANGAVKLDVCPVLIVNNTVNLRAMGGSGEFQADCKGVRVTLLQYQNLSYTISNAYDYNWYPHSTVLERSGLRVIKTQHGVKDWDDSTGSYTLFGG